MVTANSSTTGDAVALRNALLALLKPLGLEQTELRKVDEPHSVHVCRNHCGNKRHEVCYISIRQAQTSTQPKAKQILRIGGGYHLTELKERRDYDAQPSKLSKNNEERSDEETPYVVYTASPDGDTFAKGYVPPPRRRSRGSGVNPEYHYGSYNRGEKRSTRGDVCYRKGENVTELDTDEESQPTVAAKRSWRVLSSDRRNVKAGADEAPAESLATKALEALLSAMGHSHTSTSLSQELPPPVVSTTCQVVDKWSVEFCYVCSDDIREQVVEHKIENPCAKACGRLSSLCEVCAGRCTNGCGRDARKCDVCDPTLCTKDCGRSAVLCPVCAKEQPCMKLCGEDACFFLCRNCYPPPCRKACGRPAHVCTTCASQTSQQPCTKKCGRYAEMCSTCAAECQQCMKCSAKTAKLCERCSGKCRGNCGRPARMCEICDPPDAIEGPEKLCIRNCGRSSQLCPICAAQCQGNCGRAGRMCNVCDRAPAGRSVSTQTMNPAYMRHGDTAPIRCGGGYHHVPTSSITSTLKKEELSDTEAQKVLNCMSSDNRQSWAAPARARYTESGGGEHSSGVLRSMTPARSKSMSGDRDKLHDSAKALPGPVGHIFGTYRQGPAGAQAFENESGHRTAFRVFRSHLRDCDATIDSSTTPPSPMRRCRSASGVHSAEQTLKSDGAVQDSSRTTMRRPRSTSGLRSAEQTLQSEGASQDSSSTPPSTMRRPRSASGLRASEQTLKSEFENFHARLSRAVHRAGR